jgi:hypothetical protein
MEGKKDEKLVEEGESKKQSEIGSNKAKRRK